MLLVTGTYIALLCTSSAENTVVEWSLIWGACMTLLCVLDKKTQLCEISDGIVLDFRGDVSPEGTNSVQVHHVKSMR